MADIAILVAEEYERRVKNSRKVGEEVELNLVSPVVEMAIRVKNKVGQHHNMETVKKLVLEPKSQFGVAASDGLFSA